MPSAFYGRWRGKISSRSKWYLRLRFYMTVRTPTLFKRLRSISSSRILTNIWSKFMTWMMRQISVTWANKSSLDLTSSRSIRLFQRGIRHLRLNWRTRREAIAVPSRSSVKRRRLTMGRHSVHSSWKPASAQATTCSWPLPNIWVNKDSSSLFTSQNAKWRMVEPSNIIRSLRTLILWQIATKAVKWCLLLGSTRSKENTRKFKLGLLISPNSKKAPSRVKILLLRVPTVISQSNKSK